MYMCIYVCVEVYVHMYVCTQKHIYDIATNITATNITTTIATVTTDTQILQLRRMLRLMRCVYGSQVGEGIGKYSL